jgi:glycosyltransferase involved in cell wall biosynthesis
VTRHRVVVLRGAHLNPWELRSWQRLPDRFEVVFPVIAGNQFELALGGLEQVNVRALSDLMPPGGLRDLAVRAPLNRYLGIEKQLAGAAVVHAAELHPWYTAQAARLKPRVGYKLVVTVWETIPFADAYRNVLTRPHRRLVIERTDLFMAATERARDALLLEGAPAEKIVVAPPGIDLDRFGAAAATSPARHEILSPGRLVWEKGHQDVLRSVAALRAGLAGRRLEPRVLIVGSGGEERRLKAYARDLGIADAVEFRRHVPYDEMPGVYARASCMVLASLPIRGWEEQFGMVLAEGMAAGLPLLASTSGAIPEVAGDSATYFSPGDWVGLARALADGPLSGAPGARVEHPAERVEMYSTAAAASRLAAAYDRVLSS